MTAEHFEKRLQAYQKRKPFRSFRVRFISGEHIDVDHPEAVIIRAGVGVYVNAEGVPTLFDHEASAKSSVKPAAGRRDAKSFRRRLRPV